LDDSGL
jgi:hypothetical protein